MKKRIIKTIALAMSLLMMFALAACGGSDETAERQKTIYKAG